MKLGLLTAPFPETPLEEVADWAAAKGSTMLEVCCLASGEGDARRYGGTSPTSTSTGLSEPGHGDRRRPGRAGVSDLGARLLPQPAPPRPRARETVIDHLKKVITAAAHDGCAGGQHVHRRRRRQRRRRRTGTMPGRCGRRS